MDRRSFVVLAAVALLAACDSDELIQTAATVKYSDLVVGVDEMTAVDERGNQHRVKNWQITEAGFQAMRDGFMCHECTEWPLPQAFPERCPICGVRDGEACDTAAHELAEIARQGS